MTIRAYISDKLKAYGVSEAQLIDLSISSGLDLDANVTDYEPSVIGIALTHTLEECILAPRVSNVSESGFSMSWDCSSASKYYIWLCRKWGLTPNADVMEMLGVSTIIDRTDDW